MIEKILDYLFPSITTTLSSIKIVDLVFILLIIGLVGVFLLSLYKDRRNKKESNIEVYQQSGVKNPLGKLGKDEYRLSYMGITLESLNRFIPTLKKSLKNYKIRILICNPDSHLLPDIEQLVNSNNTSERIHGTIGMLNSIRKGEDISQQELRNLEIRIYDVIPTHSMIMVESKNDDNSFIHLEPYPYAIYQEERRILRILNKKNKELFKMYQNSFDNIWNKAKELVI